MRDYGIESIQPKSTITLKNLQISESNGYAINTNISYKNQLINFKINNKINITLVTIYISFGVW